MITSPTSFPYFPKLPAELRLRIWEYASPPPRIVEIAWSSKVRSLVSLTRMPPILHTCHESRQAHIRKHQNLTFGESNQRIFVNFNTDTLFFGPGCKHLVPSGKSNPWVKQNRKVVSDITNSSVLKQNLALVAFDRGFLVAMEFQEYTVRQLGEILDVMVGISSLTLVLESDAGSPEEEEEKRRKGGEKLRFSGVKEVTERDPGPFSETEEHIKDISGRGADSDWLLHCGLESMFSSSPFRGACYFRLSLEPLELEENVGLWSKCCGTNQVSELPPELEGGMREAMFEFRWVNDSFTKHKRNSK
ncbi:uncharacterized protein PAC_04270 [Phialocephala subalpina]|uniref:2EXR domain-containing protein n=1 Tax=Phialocephala subalpina TaxID=576137 RepID=A0A1L7WNN6_9HELO|nr:uncharacterized protein PAC_04270 [Phialocephala subalpina]